SVPEVLINHHSPLTTHHSPLTTHLGRGWLYCCSIWAMSLFACSAQAASPSPCSINTLADKPARKSGHRLSFSIQMRTGTRCTTLVNSPETTLRGMSANSAPVDLLIQTTRPLNG